MSGGRARVAGVMVVRDEWPLLAVTVTNLLEHHVDRLTVYDHASTDGTMDGLLRLQRHWGDRLLVRQLGDVPFLQSAIVTTALVEIAFEPFDWVYVCDADEIALVRERPLAEVLAAVPAHVGLVRYEVENWIAPQRFDTVRVDDLTSVTARACVDPSLAASADRVGDRVARGELNYFSVPFESKVIVRNGRSVWLAPGAHFADDAMAPDEASLPRDDFVVAHLPLLSEDRLVRRADHSLALREAGFEETHGWQSHAIADIARAGRIHDFWEDHSIREGGTGPAHVVDDELATTIELALKVVAASPGLLDPPIEPVVAPVAVVTTSRAIVSLHELQRSLRAQIHAREEQLDAKSAEIAWLRSVVGDLERFRASAEEVRAAEARELDALRDERDRMLASKTWRWGRRLRRVARGGRR